MNDMTEDQKLHQESAAAFAEHEAELDRYRALVGSPVLVKSIMDHFSYALKLRTGEIIRFAEAEYCGGDWIHLVEACFQVPISEKSQDFPRGIDIRISDIVWAQDDPL